MTQFITQNTNSDVWRSRFYFIQIENGDIKVRNMKTKQCEWAQPDFILQHQKVILFPNYERADWLGAFGNDYTKKYNKSMSANNFDRVSEEVQKSSLEFGGVFVPLNTPMVGTFHMETITFQFLKIIPDKVVKFSNNAIIYIYCMGIREVTDTQITYWENKQ